MTTTSHARLDRAALLDRFSRSRARTRALFDVLDERVYYERPIGVRNPIVFYEGHLPAFAINTVIKKGMGGRGVDEELERIFARGIDPESEATAIARGNPAWPDRDTVRQFASEADRLIEEAIQTAELDRDGNPLLHRGEALWAILEHEEMHQETLAYMWHQVPYALKKKPATYYTLPPTLNSSVRGAGPAPATERSWPSRVQIPAGIVSLGTNDHEPFAWDNERPSHRVLVDGFAIDAFNVTNADYMAFVDAGGYRSPEWWRPEDWEWIATAGVTHPHFWEREDGTWYWRAMFERVPLPERWPVYVTWAEANAFARWRGGRLPTEAEFHRAAYGTSHGAERQYPWGNALRGAPPANFDFKRWDPERVGASPAAASAFGVHDLIGNGWEWTSTVFAPFDGFRPMASYPEYSADFFDDDHFVMKGASPMTARGLVRPGFRNWFRPRYPYVYATFRTVTRDAR